MTTLEINKICFDFLYDYYQYYSGPMFQTRVRNNSKKKDKGYFFLGNEHYVHISFWNGQDHAEKIHHIGFVISEDGNSYIEISARDDTKKSDYIRGLINYLELNTDKKYIEYKRKNKWYCSYESADFIGNLVSFIEYDKKIIDNYLRQNDTNFISFLEIEKFDKNITSHLKIRNQLEIENQNRNIELKNESSTLIEKKVHYEMTRFHNKLQNSVYKSLEANREYVELLLEDNYVDIVGKNNDGSTVFYEIKPGKAKKSIRNSIGQLLEYNHYPLNERSEKLIIVSDEAPCENDKTYLQLLRSKYGVPIYYQFYSFDKGILSELF